MGSTAEYVDQGTFPSLLLINALGQRSGKIAYQEKDLGIWQSYTWLESYNEVVALANGLASLGFKRGDKMVVAGDNRPHLYWGMLAAQSLGGVPVPLYQDSIEKEMEYIVSHCEARFALVEDQEQADKILNIKENCELLEYIIYNDPRGLQNYPQQFLIKYLKLQEQGRLFAAENPKFFEEEVAKGAEEDMAVICYTSGTTGKPKGVMLSHRNFVFTSREMAIYENLAEHESLIAYLPMAWVGDFFLSYGLALSRGFTVSCPENGETVMQDLREIGPTLFFAPPRIWENLLTNVMVRMEDASWIKRKMFSYFIEIARVVQEKRSEGKSVGLKEKLLYQIGRVLVYEPLKDSLGLGKIRNAITAGEAIGPEIFAFFRSLGINLKQLYGMTEASVFISQQKTGEVKPDTCGPPMPWVDIRISDSGEVLFRGPGVFMGYYRNEEATKTAMDEDWVRTGDAGYIDEDGHLKIIDRAKDVGTLSDGTMFAPKYIENKLKFSPYIKEAVAVGMERPYVAAMINIDLESVGNWAERRGIAYTGYNDIAQKPQVRDLIFREVKRVNQTLAGDSKLSGAQIRKFLILHKELDPDDEEMTRTRKVRRRFINEKYEKLISAMYSDAGNVEVRAKVTFEDGRTTTIDANLSITAVESFG